MRFKAKRIGWFGDSKADNIVKINKADREHLGIQLGAVVRIKKGNNSCLAIVRTQFFDLIAYPEVASCNKLLTEELSIGENDTIEITADVTEEQVNEYTNQQNFLQRQVKGTVLSNKEKKDVKDVMQRLGLFADEQPQEERAEEDEGVD